MTWQDFDAVLFDLDGVVTPTAEVHMRAWSEMFNAFLSSYDEPGADTSPYADDDYFAHVDGKPRYDGVRDFLDSRHISLPDGSADDPASADTVAGLGNRKNDAFNEVLERDGVTAYPGSVLLLDHLRELGMPLAVVSSSANAPAVLEAAGLVGPVRHRRQRQGRDRARPARQARARHVPARRRGARRDAPTRPWCSRTPCPASAPARPVTSGW